MSWILAGKDRRALRLPAFFDWQFDDHLRHGLVTVSEGCEVAAYWRMPGKVHHHDPMTLSEGWRLLRIFGLSLPRGDTLGRAISRHVPRGEDCLYLRYVGVHGECQGKGWGGLAIRDGIARAEGLGIGLCL